MAQSAEPFSSMPVAPFPPRTGAGPAPCCFRGGSRAGSDTEAKRVTCRRLTPDECLRRLAKVTTYRRDRWYSDWRTATLPDPLFQGELWPSGLRLALFTANMARGYGAWFEARIDPAPEGGTTLTGTVGWPGVWAGKEAPIPGLLRVINGVLDSTSEFP